MGGHLGGETASATVRDGLIALLADKEPDSAALETGVEAVNRRVYLKSEEDEHLRGMGTTLTVLWLGDEDAMIAHVGDSRCYHIHAGGILQVSQDHSLVEELVQMGRITAEEARLHPNRNIITRALGTEHKVQGDLYEVALSPGDRLLLCSDGLSNEVQEREMLSLMAPSLEESCQALLELALNRGAPDNVTVVLLEAERESAQGE
jgi:protein phosphatase